MLNLLLCGIRATQRDVVRHGVGKKKWRLADHRQAATPAIELQLRQGNIMKANLPLADVEMTLNERQQGTFAGTGRPANAQHLTGFQGEINVFQRRMISLRIRKLANIYIQFAPPLRNGVATIVHYWRFSQHRANTAVRSTTTFHNVKHPCQRQHRPNHQT